MTNKFIFTIPKENSMNVPGKLFLSQKLYDNINDDCIDQVKNVASLPGIVKASIAMPDIHKGYGFPIGGVAAFDSKKGIITPGGIGFDINCGIRVLTTNLTKKDVLPKIDELLEKFLEYIGVGMGEGSITRLSINELNDILENGVNWAFKKGYANENDLEFCEENGCFNGASSKVLSQKAKGRGINQLGSLGSGNHFIEIQCVDEILEKSVAKILGITKKNQVVIMIHSGSRGLGHQVASDYLRKIEDEYEKEINNLPERDLAYAPINSKLGKEYYLAMKCAANYAFANRQVMTHFVRKSFAEVFEKVINIDLLYDLSHNIAKMETHFINGKMQEVCVHRKGATRSFGPFNKEIPLKYQLIGQPVLLPGSMGTFSYILTGTNTAMKESFGSCAHGAGRNLSRKKANDLFDSKTIIQELKEKEIIVKGVTQKGITEEAPGAYKDVSEVIKTLNETKLATPVVKLKPLGVIKG